MDSFHVDSNSVYPSVLNQECKSLKGYKRNQYKSEYLLDDKLKNEIQKRWSNQFSRFSYSLNYNDE